MQEQELVQLHRRTNLEEVMVKKLYGVPLQLTLEQEQVFFIAYNIILLLQPPTIQVAILPIHITLCFQSLFKICMEDQELLQMYRKTNLEEVIVKKYSWIAVVEILMTA
jgi:hypothetical protein